MAPCCPTFTDLVTNRVWCSTRIADLTEVGEILTESGGIRTDDRGWIQTDRVGWKTDIVCWMNEMYEVFKCRRALNPTRLYIINVNSVVEYLMLFLFDEEFMGKNTFQDCCVFPFGNAIIWFYVLEHSLRLCNKNVTFNWPNIWQHFRYIKSIQAAPRTFKSKNFLSNSWNV